ncbi:MAG TPA: hypothetical protein VD962_09830 [Rubricoccaceae bacterium]|nr:hypothetical protein [Rubricoccaceae bacterium]
MNAPLPYSERERLRRLEAEENDLITEITSARRGSRRRLSAEARLREIAPTLDALQARLDAEERRAEELPTPAAPSAASGALSVGRGARGAATATA